MDCDTSTRYDIAATTLHPHTQGYVLGHTADSTPLKATVAGVSKGTRAILLDIVGVAVTKE